MSRIARLHWDEVDPTGVSWLPPGPGRLIAVVPGPSDPDLCLQNAGFVDWGDQDEAWDEDFAAFLGGLIEALSRLGPAIVVTGDYTVKPSLWDRLLRRSTPTPTVLDVLVWATIEDSPPAGLVHFGKPAEAALRTSDGHPIVWLWLSATQGAIDLKALSHGRPVERTRLRWQGLV